jgi:glycosyltransferase involved in cell wall biosynthesis
MKILLLDNTAPWVVSLFDAAAAQGTAVRAIRPQSLGALRLPAGPRTGQRDSGQKVTVPGWTRFFKLSTLLVARAVRRALRQQPDVDAIVYTLPQYAAVAQSIRGPRCAYYAHDVFRFYDWDRAATMELEQRMLDRVDVVFSVAEALSEDFRRMTRTPVHTCRMAASSAFIQRLRAGPPVAAELQPIRKPIVGCTGQINRSYDWDLIAALAGQLPDVSFVFIGPIFDEPSPMRERVRSALGLPNVHWLGPVPHTRLPEYLAGFDVCFNPLLVNEHNDRRSPLRLYDYLATDKPILSTGIREAQIHRPFIEIGQTPEQCAAILRRFADGQSDLQLAERHRYIEQNTWENRAALVLQTLQNIGQSRT